jgi:hypothetical protein
MLMVMVAAWSVLVMMSWFIHAVASCGFTFAAAAFFVSGFVSAAGFISFASAAAAARFEFFVFIDICHFIPPSCL